MGLASKLNKRVSIMRPYGPDDPPPARDKYGQPLDEQVEVAKVWAAIDQPRGSDFYAAQRENAEVTAEITIRYRDGIDKTMTILHGDHEFEILYILQPKFGKKELLLMCKELQ